jgi:hypothetical protein
MAWSSSVCSTWPYQASSKLEKWWSVTHGSLGSMASSEDSSGDSASSEAGVGGLLCRARSSEEEIRRQCTAARLGVKLSTASGQHRGVHVARKIRFGGEKYLKANRVAAWCPSAANGAGEDDKRAHKTLNIINFLRRSNFKI